LTELRTDTVICQPIWFYRFEPSWLGTDARGMPVATCRLQQLVEK
jgi:hypothetical protein